MMTVRFPTGVAVQYNDANYALRKDSFTDIYTCQNGKWIAQVPNDCLIEVERPCRVYNSNHEPAGIVEALNRMIADPVQRRLLPTYNLAELKRRLQDLKRGRWK